MSRLKEIKIRIRSVKSTRQITKAMEMVAAAKLRRAVQRATEARPYAERMDSMLASLAAGASGEIAHPFFAVREVKRRTLVVVTSDRGLCGSFNTNILRQAEQWLTAQAGVELEIVAIGKRAQDYFKRRKWSIVRTDGDWNGALNFDRSREIVTYLTTRFTSGETDAVHLIFTRYISTVKYRVENQSYLPIPRPAVGQRPAVGERPGLGERIAVRKEYIFEPNAESIYASLMPRYALTKLVTALLDSFASEHSARMIAMHSATKNADDMISNLTRTFNKVRQGQITKEILEIVGGAEALKG